jgi:hypothetical protein
MAGAALEDLSTIITPQAKRHETSSLILNTVGLQSRGGTRQLGTSSIFAGIARHKFVFLPQFDIGCSGGRLVRP